MLRPVYTVRLVGPINGGGFEKNRADLKICCTATDVGPIFFEAAAKNQADKSHRVNRPLENEGFKVLWDFNVQCDRIVEVRRPDINKQAKEAMIIDVAIPGDARVKDKELEIIENYQLLREEIRKLWKLKKVTVVPVVIGALGAVCI